MLPYGADRVRTAGDRLILHSRLPKGWTARRPREGTHAEYPGTAILWDDQYFEVVSADALQGGGVRYVLEPWKDEHVIRVFLSYSAESEQQLLDDHLAAQNQRRVSVLARLSGILLGNLPEVAQRRLSNTLGVSPVAMTLLSCIPAVLLLGICAFRTAGAILGETRSPIPLALWIIAYAWFAESLLRFIVAMTQNRGIGSLIGCLVYLVIAPKDVVNGTRDVFKSKTLDITPDIELQDRITMRGPLLTLLSVDEQQQLAERYGFDHRAHAYPIAFIILGCALLGVLSSALALTHGMRFSALTSLILASTLAVEQMVRIPTLRRGPVPSILGFIARPFARDLLEHP